MFRPAIFDRPSAITRFLSLIPYWYLLVVPTALIYLGAAINVLVMAANHALMPVVPPGGQCTKEFEFWLAMVDHGLPMHSCMSAQSHLRFLADWMNLFSSGLGLTSPADLLIWLGSNFVYPALYVWIVLMIRDANARRAWK